MIPAPPTTSPTSKTTSTASALLSLPLLTPISASVRVLSFSSYLTPPDYHPTSILESSRRDDLESLAYMLIYFIRGTLPWRKVRAPHTPPDHTPSPSQPSPTHYNPVSETWNLIRDAKISAEPLLTVGLPPEFDVLYRYARGLEFDDLPDYEGLRKLFRGLAERMGVEYDDVYDWTVPATSGGHRRLSEGGGRRYCEACNARSNSRR